MSDRRKIKLSTASSSSIWSVLDKMGHNLGLDLPTVQPANSITVNEYVERYRCSQETARKRLTVLVSKGLLTKVLFWGASLDGARRKTLAYVAKS